MVLPLIAIPVLHSSGGWIAYAGTGYLAGTLSGSWIGAFVLGNSGLLASLGLVSSAGIFGAAGGFAALGSTAAVGLGTALGAVGLGGLASALGIVPVAAFLGLTPAGWAIVGAAALAAIGAGVYAFSLPLLDWTGAGLSAIGLRSVAEWLGIAPAPTFLGLTAVDWAWLAVGATVMAVLGYLGHRTMGRINEERRKGGEPPITISGIFREVRDHECRSLGNLLRRPTAEMGDVTLSADEQSAVVRGRSYPVRRLKYVINRDGSEEITFRPWPFGRTIRLLLVKPAGGVVL